MEARSNLWWFCFASLGLCGCAGRPPGSVGALREAAPPDGAPPGDSVISGELEAAGDGGVLPIGCDGPDARTVHVMDAGALEKALANARPGDQIRLSDGVYAGNFIAEVSGTSANPIVLCGSRQAVLRGSSLSSGYGFQLAASYWVLSGFRVTGSQKGIVVHGGSFNRLTGLEVDHVGQEGIHFRKASSGNVLTSSWVHDTGTGPGARDKGFGEGVYLGSAVNNWDLYGDNGGPDQSDRNQVIDNTIGPSTAAECVDIKEGTTGGIVRGNTFDGTGMSGDNFADSWIDVKGSDYRIEDNHGSHALLDGFQTHVQVAGWGNDNRFSGNAMSDVPGYGINVARASTGTIVACSNIVTAGGLGLSNVACQ
jgi:hypothetical protein